MHHFVIGIPLVVCHTHMKKVGLAVHIILGNTFVIHWKRILPENIHEEIRKSNKSNIEDLLLPRVVVERSSKFELPSPVWRTFTSTLVHIPVLPRLLKKGALHLRFLHRSQSHD